MNITNQPNFTNDDEKNISLPIRKSSKNEEVSIIYCSLQIFQTLIQLRIRIVLVM